jgi:chromate transporter
VTVTTSAADMDPPAHPTFDEMTSVFARIGCLSFGGPAGQIALMHKVLVEEKRWISEDRYLHALNYCMLLPGPEAQQLATYVGWLLHGTRGGVVAGTLFVIPGLLVMIALTTTYALFQETSLLTSLFFGLKAAVLAIVFEAVLRVARRSLRNGFMVTIAAIAFVALFFFSAPFPLVVLGAGIVGFVGARFRPEIFVSTGQHSADKQSRLRAVIDDDFDHPEASWRNTLSVIGTWGALWLAPLLLIVPLTGWGSSYALVYAFFSQMAVVTFGGAYAVLSYVAQEAVQSFGWLGPSEMVDGLALAETTPGPLVLVLSFVGFLATFRAPVGLDPIVAGIVGATLTAWVTFVPCFLWIFLGAPYVENLRRNTLLSGALSTITAAVVGVILNLGLWFALHVLFRRVDPQVVGPIRMVWPDWATVQPVALAFVVAALLAVFFLRLGMIRLLLLFAAAGVILGLVPQLSSLIA